MEMLTTRVDLGEGAWAELYNEVKRVTMRLHEAELRKHMRPADQEPLLLSRLKAGEQAWPDDYLVDAAAVDSGLVTEIYILHQVKAWSQGDVNQSAIDDMPREMFEKLREEMDRLYQPNPLPEAGGKS